jgi:hypothetical protein
MFSIDDAYLLSGVLHIIETPVNINLVLAALNTASTASIVLNDRIETDLAELVLLDKTLGEIMGSEDYAIRKLDVIEFEVEQKIVGIIMRYKMLAQRLVSSLGLTKIADLTWLNTILQQLGVPYGGLETLTLKKAH